MRRPIQLQPGQLNPQAQPVSTFVQPGQKDTIKAARPELLPQPGQVNTIATAGTGQVQGENSFRALAKDLEIFNPQLMKTAETAGLKYVDWRMDVGEAQAMEQVQRGLAQLDEGMEVAGDQRAADNRRLSAVDPEAGWLMRTLDPYQQMGYQRGLVKQAGQQIALGLPAYVQQMQGEVDPATGKPYVNYGAPDMGMAGLQKLQAQYQLELEAKYGISSSSPGYQKYFAPNLLRAQGRVAEQVLDDRTKFFESQIGPAAITSTLGHLRSGAAEKSDIVTVDEQGEFTKIPYLVKGVSGRYEVNSLWVIARAADLSEQFKSVIARAPLGMGAEISEELYKTVAAQFPEGSLQRRILDQMQGPDGKTFGSRFGYLSREASLQYAKDQAQFQTNTDKLLDRQFNDTFRTLLDSGNINANQAADITVKTINTTREGAGLPPLTAAQEARLKANAIRQIDQISPVIGPQSGQPVDPRSATRFLTDLQSQDLYSIDVQAGRNYLNQIRDSLPEGQLGAYSSAVSRLDQAASAQKERGSWVGQYSNYQKDRMDVLLGDQGDLWLEGLDLTTAEDLITNEFESRMTTALQVLRGDQDKPLTQEQVNGVARDQWAVLQKEVLDGEFAVPGYKGTPSVEGQTPRPLQNTPGTEEAAPVGYNLDQLDRFPRRSVRLRSYRDVNNGPILSADALISVISTAASGGRENPAFTKAWRQAKAPNAWSFIESQLRFYPRLGNGKGWTDEQLQRAKQDLLSVVVRDSNLYATAQMLEYSPAMARLNNWVNEIA
nr:hypothetical protein [uncultured Mediterranean phage uvMED]